MNKDDLTLRNRINSNRFFDAETNAPNIVKIEKKYSNITITDQILSDDLLLSFFINGCYDQSILEASLDNSVYFLKPEEADPWKVVMRFDSMETTIVEKNLRLMKQQFAEHEITEPGELLHFFSLFLMMADEGISGKSLDEVHIECSDYIDNIIKHKKLKPYNPQFHKREDISDNYGGFLYWVTEASKPYFDQLYQKLQNARNNAFKQTIPTIACDILKLLTDDPEALIHKISYTFKAEDSYANVPVLHEIDPRQFVNSWLSLPHKNWKDINYALCNRYKNRKLYSELSEEITWAKTIFSLLLTEAESATGLDSLRIRRIIPPIFHEEFGSTHVTAIEEK